MSPVPQKDTHATPISELSA